MSNGIFKFVQINMKHLLLYHATIRFPLPTGKVCTRLCRLLIVFQKSTYFENLSGMLPVQTVWIKVLVSNCLQRLSADDISIHAQR